MYQEVFPDISVNEITDLLNSSPQCVYAGFDPTSDSLHVGNLLILMNLLHWQRGGHNVLVVIGGATANIGDPSGRTIERDILSKSFINLNVKGLHRNITDVFSNHEKYFWHSNKLLPQYKILNNQSWYDGIGAVDLIGRVGRHLRMGTLLSRTSVQTRLSTSVGMSFTEFSYQLFQSYDWLHLFEQYGCLFQIGGSDQMGNIMSGHDLIGRIHKKLVYGLTLPLITTEIGDKFGKSAGNAVWLSPEKTSPFTFYQFWIRTPDSSIAHFLKLFTFDTLGAIDDLMRQHKEKPELRLAQKRLAEQVTVLVHGENGLEQALTATKALYEGNVSSLTEMKLEDIVKMFEGASVVRLHFEAGQSVMDMAMKAECFPTKADAVRIIKAGGFYINQKRTTNPDEVLNRSIHCLSNNLSLVRVGKRNYYVVQFKETCEQGKGSTTKNLLSGLSMQQIKNITVSIRRPHVPHVDVPTVIQTSLDDPTTLSIHRKGEGEQPIFSRKDIVVNVEEHLEERIVSTSPERISKRIRSRSHSKDSYRRSSSKDSNKSSRSSLPCNASKDDYLEKRYGEASRKKSVSTGYQKGEYHHRNYERRSKGDSPKPTSSKSKYQPHNDTFINSKRDYRDTPSKKYDKNRSYSRSPSRSGHTRGMVQDKDNYVRRRSRSSSVRRRSRSPFHSKRTPSPYTSKRRSRSPYLRRTPKRSTRRSKTPYDERKKYPSSSRPFYYKKRTPSPYTKKRSRSPYRSRKRSSTPLHRDRDRFRRRDRSKSPQGHRTSTIENNSIELGGYKGMHPEFDFYGAEGYWLPGPIPRPGFIPRGMVQPPRGLFRPPYFNHRPYMPFPYPDLYYRPRFPIPHHRPLRPKLSPTTTSTSTSAIESAPATVTAESTSTTVIEEVKGDLNELNSNVSTDK
ncbi:hypothetical protein FQR65_LT00024 [Abscondita terminalis]|nr:hypothetical protein FQR65_LT00024 [Abscondita terminalis]